MELSRALHEERPAFLEKRLECREVEYAGPGGSWSDRHHKWLRTLEFSDHPSRSVFNNYLAAVVFLEQRRDGLDAQIEIAARRSPWAVTIANLRCLRGISTVTAYGVCCEVGDFRRFKHPSTLNAYLGIVPSEHSSGEQIKRGPITKAGSPHARRLLVEAAHHYRHAPAQAMAPRSTR